MTQRTVELLVAVLKDDGTYVERLTSLDIVPGWCPMLCGTALQADMGLVPSAVHKSLLIFAQDGSYRGVQDSWQDGACVLNLNTEKPKNNRSLKRSRRLLQGGALAYTVLLNGQAPQQPADLTLQPASQKGAGLVPSPEVKLSDKPISSNSKKTKPKKSLKRLLAADAPLSSLKNIYSEADDASSDDMGDMLLKRKRPFCLRLSEAQMYKIHSAGHEPAGPCCDTMLRSLSPADAVIWSAQKLKAVTRMTIVCQTCKYCHPHGKNVSPTTHIHAVIVTFNVKVVIDIWESSDDQVALKRNQYPIPGVRYWHLTIICAGSGRNANVPFDKKPNAAAIVHALFIKWIAVWGPIKELLVSDNGGEFVNAAVCELAARCGFVKEVTAAYMPQSHGLVEVLNRVYRACWKRSRTEQGWRPITLIEAEFLSATIENELNNTLQNTGYSASQRSTGRDSHLISNLIADNFCTPIEPQHCVSDIVSSLVRMQNDAMDAYRAVVHDRRLRCFLKERSRGKIMVFRQGDYVCYHRPSSNKNAETFLGPASVVGYNPNSKVYILQHGGTLVNRSPLHLKPYFSGPRRRMFAEDPAVIANQVPAELVELVIQEFQERDVQPKITASPDRGLCPLEEGIKLLKPDPVETIPEVPFTQFYDISSPPIGNEPRTIGLVPEAFNQEATDGPLGVPTHELVQPPVPSTKVRSKPRCVNLLDEFNTTQTPLGPLGPPCKKRKLKRQSEAIRGSVKWVYCQECEKPRVLNTRQFRKFEHPNSQFTCSMINRSCDEPSDDPHDEVGYTVLDPTVFDEKATTSVIPEPKRPRARSSSPTVAVRRSRRQQQLPAETVMPPDKLKRHLMFASRTPHADGSAVRKTSARVDRSSTLISSFNARVAHPHCFNSWQDSDSEDEPETRPKVVYRVLNNMTDDDITLTERTHRALAFWRAPVTTSRQYAKNLLEYNEETCTSHADKEKRDLYRLAMHMAKMEDHAGIDQTVLTTSTTRLRETDAAHYSWEGLSPAEQKEAMGRAIEDYTKYNCWHKETSTFGAVKQLDPNAQIYTGTWVKKAVVRDGKVIGKCRYTPRGFEEKGSWAGMYEAPTAAATTHRSLEAYGLALRWSSFVVDFARAFFQGDPYKEGSWEHSHAWMVDPIQPEGAKGDNRRVVKLLKDVPGLRRAPQSWQRRLRRTLLKTGHVPSRTDAAMYLHLDKDGAVDAIVPTHVDDVRGRATKDYCLNVLPLITAELEVGKCQCYHYEDVVKQGQVTEDFLGRTWIESVDGTRIHMRPYIDAKIHEYKWPDPTERTLVNGRSRLIRRETQGQDPLVKVEYDAFRALLGQMLWVETCRPEISFELSRIAGNMCEPTVNDLLDLNKTARYLRRTNGTAALFIPRLNPESLDDFRLTVITDASDGSMQSGKSQGGYAIGLQCISECAGGDAALFASILSRSHRIRRVCHSSYDAEMLEIVDAVDHALLISMLFEEFRKGPRPSLYERRLLAGDGFAYVDDPTTIKLYTDSESSITKIASEKDSDGSTRRRRIDIADMRECIAYSVLLPLGFIAGECNPVDILTKNKGGFHTQAAHSYFRLMYGGTFFPEEVPINPKRKTNKLKYEPNMLCKIVNMGPNYEKSGWTHDQDGDDDEPMWHLEF